MHSFTRVRVTGFSTEEDNEEQRTVIHSVDPQVFNLGSGQQVARRAPEFDLRAQTKPTKKVDCMLHYVVADSYLNY